VDLQSGPKSVNWLTMCTLNDIMNLQNVQNDSWET